MKLSALKKLAETAFSEHGGWDAYRARAKALAELPFYVPKLIAVAEAAKSLTYANGGPATVLEEKLIEALELLESA